MITKVKTFIIIDGKILGSNELPFEKFIEEYFNFKPFKMVNMMGNPDDKSTWREIETRENVKIDTGGYFSAKHLVRQNPAENNGIISVPIYI